MENNSIKEYKAKLINIPKKEEHDYDNKQKNKNKRKRKIFIKH